jgi:hypothetical protein
MINAKNFTVSVFTIAATISFLLVPIANGNAQEQSPPCEKHQYSYDRKIYTCQVPENVNQISILAGGGMAGYGTGSTGGPGRGLLIEGTVPVIPGEILQIETGSRAGGYNKGVSNWKPGEGGSGGRPGSGFSAHGAGGGGASAVIGSKSGVLIVAGGGGGGGGQAGNKGNDGNDGGNGGNGALNPGGGKTGQRCALASAGGTGGTGGQSGMTSGGNGADANTISTSGSGGGGGGGYVAASSGTTKGGGAGGQAGQSCSGGGGGGGGASYVITSATGVKESPPQSGKKVSGFVKLTSLVHGNP